MAGLCNNEYELKSKDGILGNKINVIENKGRYTGNSTLLEITYKVRFVKKK